jgi:hypothetical protein
VKARTPPIHIGGYQKTIYGNDFTRLHQDQQQVGVQASACPVFVSIRTAAS